jgi:hypothetical protein
LDNILNRDGGQDGENIDSSSFDWSTLKEEEQKKKKRDSQCGPDRSNGSPKTAKYTRKTIRMMISTNTQQAGIPLPDELEAE